MNLFRSEEHVRNWSGFKTGTDEGILSLDQFMAIFRTPRHRDKFSGRYVSSAPQYVQEFYDVLRKVTRGSAFWAPPS